MEFPSLSLSLLSVFLLFSLLQSPTFAVKKSYVVYFGAHSHGPLATSANYDKVKTTHYGFLASFLGSEEKAKDAILYSYTRHINGFSAVLDEEEATELSSTEENMSFQTSSVHCILPLLTFRHFLIFTVENPEVKSIFLNKGRKLHTTRSWEFLGLERDGRTLAGSLWQNAKFGEDVIIGNLDSAHTPALWNGDLPSRNLKTAEDRGGHLPHGSDEQAAIVPRCTQGWSCSDIYIRGWSRPILQPS